METLLIVIGITAIITLLVLSYLSKNLEYNYSSRKYLLTKVELNFFKQLNKLLPQEYLVMSKVRLADIITTKEIGKAKIYSFNKIKSKHVDFVVINKECSEILLVIELNDRTHLQSNRVLRDDFLAKALKNAGIPFKTFVPKNFYSQEEITSLFIDGIKSD